MVVFPFSCWFLWVYIIYIYIYAFFKLTLEYYIPMKDTLLSDTPLKTNMEPKNDGFQ